LSENVPVSIGRSVDREKANHVNLFSLCFRDPEKERQV
jgi:hypothetical protein